MTSRASLLSFLLVSSVLISSCAPNAAFPTDVDTEPVIDDAQAVPDEEEAPVGDAAILSAEPQGIVFQSMDGVDLQGIYYPSGKADAVLVVLMHWAQGDQMDWEEIAFWLQNRGLSGTGENPGDAPWLDPSWFPPISPDTTYAVFTFTFRGCEGGCSSFERENWLFDAQSAAEFARSLEGIDPDRIIFMGASIGADGAADGCLYLGSQFPSACRGAFSLSPGSYLTLDYSQVVTDLNTLAPTIPARCLYSADDPESFGLCDGIESPNYEGVLYESGAVPGFPHGMMLIQPEVDPNPLGLMLEFLEEVAD